MGGTQLNAFLSAIEMIASIVEGFIIFAAVACLSEEKYIPRKELVYIGGCALILAVFASILNQFSIFSFITIILSLVAVIIMSRWISKAGLIQRAAATVTAFLVIHTIDYLVFFIMGIIINHPVNGVFSFTVDEMANSPTLRPLYLLIDKGMDVLVFLLLRKKMHQANSLSQKYYQTLLITSSITYVLISIIISMLLSRSLMTMQVAVILLWVFMLICIVMVIIILTVSSGYQAEKEENQLLELTNSLMTENYQKLREIQNESAKTRHDFNHHLKVLAELAIKDGSKDIENYIQGLLDTTISEAKMCHSGNDIIDAIINSKQLDANHQAIQFHYLVNFSIPTNIQATDLCAILANQIDNAFDAVSMIPSTEKRIVDVHIWQKTGNIAILQVSNEVQANPFDLNPQLHSTKSDVSRPHGLGLSSIRDTAKKYHGTVENTFKDGKFISTVLLCYEPVYSQENQ